MPDRPRHVVNFGFVLTAIASMAALAATFVAATSSLEYRSRLTVFLVTVFTYLCVCFLVFIWQRRTLLPETPAASGDPFDAEVEGKLFALEEANEFFGASLRSADMFRLVSSRIGEIVPFETCVLFAFNEEDGALRVKYAVGENARDFMVPGLDVNRSLAAKTFLGGRPTSDPDLAFDRRVFTEPTLAGLRSAIAAPLCRNGEKFGVLVLYSDLENAFEGSREILFGAAAERAAPLFASSFAFEQSLSNALTDPLTSLPNERAFFLVLENQIAESQRYRDVRPLTILAIDIEDFTELNQSLGHATGDRILAHAAQTIRKQLRQMDVLARHSADEFLAILPTAGEKVAAEIIGRIERAFVTAPFELDEENRIHLRLNFGWASFWRDGETARTLLQSALVRKHQQKTTEQNKILWFPKDLVN